MYVLWRHVRENNPNKPIDHDEDGGGERQAPSKPSFQPRFKIRLTNLREHSKKTAAQDGTSDFPIKGLAPKKRKNHKIS